MKHGDASDDNFGALGSNAGDLLAAGKIAGSNFRKQSANLSSGSGTAIGFFALGSPHSIYGAYGRCRRCGGSDHAVDFGLGESGCGGGNALLNILAHTLDFPRVSRVAFDEHLRKPDRS